MRRKSDFDFGGCLTVLFVCTLVVAAGGGWGFNIVKLFMMANEPLTGMFILRCVGVFFFPLGIILGYL